MKARKYIGLMQMMVRNTCTSPHMEKCKIPWLELEWWADKPQFPHLPGNTNLKTDIWNI